ncbi:MAG TPA: DUF5666 domain-containing protein [Spirochaetia bacterium]|nr:DUF5666 domain-containing protein [Spirochaetia bacterium]
MKEHFRPSLTVLVVSIGLLVAGAATAGFAQAAMAVSVGGTVASVSAAQITLTAADGTTKSVVFSPDTMILERSKAMLADIKEGDAMGVTAHRAEDGNMTATAINIFPAELWKVVRKGQFPMQQPGQIMTNAVVSAYMPKGDTHALTMKYGDETYPIVVPDSTEIYRLSSVEKSLVKEGMHVLIRGNANADGSIAAAVVSFDG